MPGLKMARARERVFVDNRWGARECCHIRSAISCQMDAWMIHCSLTLTEPALFDRCCMVAAFPRQLSASIKVKVGKNMFHSVPEL